MEAIDRAIAELARRQYGVFSRKQAVALGATPRMIGYRLERAIWSSLHTGTYALVGTPTSWHRAQMAACLWCDGAAGVRAAAHLHGLPGFTSPPVEVVTETRKRPMPQCGVTVHHTKRLPRCHVVRAQGIAVTSVERTLFDLCGHVPRRQASIAVDHALHSGLTTVGALDHCLYLTARRGREGGAGLRRLVRERAELREYPNSPLETVVFNLLVEGRMKMPELQVPLYDRSGFIARPDFVWRDEKLVVEAHSFLWHENEVVKDIDRNKHERLVAAGHRILYVTWVDATTYGPATLRAVERALEGGNDPVLRLSDVEKARPDVLQLTQNG